MRKKNKKKEVQETYQPPLARTGGVRQGQFSPTSVCIIRKTLGKIRVKNDGKQTDHEPKFALESTGPHIAFQTR